MNYVKVTAKEMSTTISSENETEFRFILNVAKEFRAANKRPDNQPILDHINKKSATNMDRNHIDVMINSILEKQLIFDKPSKKGMMLSTTILKIAMTTQSQI